MLLTEQHQIKCGTDAYKVIDEAAFKSKNLYNATVFAIRQHFFHTGKYLPYSELSKRFAAENQPDFRALPSKVAQATMKIVDQNFQSFFNALKAFKSNPSKFNGHRPRLPKYLDKEKGRFLLMYNKQAISKKALAKDGLVRPSQLNITISTKVSYTDIQSVSISKRLDAYVVNITYNVPDCILAGDNGKYAAIDLGVTNFATVTSNVSGSQPFIIDGREAKSMNRYYNKELSRRKSLLAVRNSSQKTSRAIRRLTRKRSNKLHNFCHKASRMIVNQLVSMNVSTLIVGKNKGWKQDANIGKMNNQNFVQLPYEQFIFLLQYKCARAGIRCVITEESYTSKCSFLDNEPICKHGAYMGRRVKRGLFISSKGRRINADVNGSYNILRKCMPNAFEAEGVEGVVVRPRIIKIPN